MTAQEIINKVEELRKLKNIHKNSLCGNVGITTQYYNQVLSGTKGISLTVAARLADQVGLKLVLAIK